MGTFDLGSRRRQLGAIILCGFLWGGCTDVALQHHMTGNLHLNAGEVEKAVASYREAVKLRPADGHLHLLLANALQESGQAAGALLHYRKAVELAPDHWQARRELGIALFHRGDKTAAESEFRSVLKRNPLDIFTMNRLAEVYVDQQRFAEAKQVLERVLRHDPNNRVARWTRSQSALAQTMPRVALEVLNELATIEAGAYVQAELAWVHVLLEDPVAALGALGRALKKTPSPGDRLALLKSRRWRTLVETEGFDQLREKYGTP